MKQLTIAAILAGTLTTSLFAADTAVDSLTVNSDYVKALQAAFGDKNYYVQDGFSCPSVPSETMCGESYISTKALPSLYRDINLDAKVAIDYYNSLGCKNLESTFTIVDRSSNKEVYTCKLITGNSKYEINGSAVFCAYVPTSKS